MQQEPPAHMFLKAPPIAKSGSCQEKPHEIQAVFASAHGHGAYVVRVHLQKQIARLHAPYGSMIPLQPSCHWTRHCCYRLRRA